MSAGAGAAIWLARVQINDSPLVIALFGASRLQYH